MHTKNCDKREYLVVEGAEKMLKQNNYAYVAVGNHANDGDETLERSKLDTSNLNEGSVAIIKDGKIYANINPDVDEIKNDNETMSWFSKYIEI